MKVKRSLFLSLFLLALVSVWMYSGQIDGARKPDTADVVVEKSALASPVKVMIDTLTAQPITVEVVVQGQLEPFRRLELRSETGGQVSKILVRKGDAVKRGELLVTLATDDRSARVAQARAELAQQELNRDGVRRLYDRKMQSESQLKLAEASVAAAEAGLKLAQIDLGRTRIVAPFDALIEAVPIELGSFLDRGDPLLELIDNTSLKAVGYVPQQSMMDVNLQQKVDVVLLDGRHFPANINFISGVAETQTRSFRVEAALEPIAEKVGAGISAEMRIDLGKRLAHFISPAVLALDTNGQVGVKVVDDENRVSFYAVSLVRTQPDGVWVAGLPENIRLISRGQNFVITGQQVAPVPRA
jgi:membrane fusion protein, multidrug efflux system